jgi:hypothetical protein
MPNGQQSVDLFARTLQLTLSDVGAGRPDWTFRQENNVKHSDDSFRAGMTRDCRVSASRACTRIFQSVRTFIAD